MKKHYDIYEIVKPCHELGFCPYGTLVESFPLHEAAKKYAREHDMWVKFAPPQGWVKVDKNDPDATEDINSVIANGFNDPYSCTEFGHDCPVYYVAEYIVDGDLRRAVEEQ